MGNSNDAPEDLLKIIKTAKKYGLKSLSWNGISLEFSDVQKKAAPRGRSAKVVEITPEQEDALKEEQLAELLVSDPLMYEEVVQKMVLGN